MIYKILVKPRNNRISLANAVFKTIKIITAANAIRIRLVNNELNHTIEVKTTMESGFTRLGEKDINSDYLVWINFGSFFTSLGKDKDIEIYISKNVKEDFDKYFIDYTEKKKKKVLDCMRLERYFDILKDNLTIKTLDLYYFIYKREF